MVLKKNKMKKETNRKPSSLESMDRLRATKTKPIEFTSSSFTLIFQINCPNRTKSWVLTVGMTTLSCRMSAVGHTIASTIRLMLVIVVGKGGGGKK